jgi:6-phosphogluconate dehydrogenase (decarboxylating)
MGLLTEMWRNVPIACECGAQGRPHCDDNHADHLVKMVYTRIEYGAMLLMPRASTP